MGQNDISQSFGSGKSVVFESSAPSNPVLPSSTKTSVSSKCVSPRTSGGRQSQVCAKTRPCGGAFDGQNSATLTRRRLGRIARCISEMPTFLIVLIWERWLTDQMSQPHVKPRMRLDIKHS